EQARQAVERFTEITESELADFPFQGARRRFLEAALLYNHEFLEEAGDDASIKEELAVSRERVTRILKELTDVEGSGQHMLLTERDVLDDLRVTPQQREQLKRFASRLEAQNNERFRDAHKLSPMVRQQRFVETARANEAEVAKILTPDQRQRLRQIAVQQK